jgi:hypothetical protein
MEKPIPRVRSKITIIKKSKISHINLKNKKLSTKEEESHDGRQMNIIISRMMMRTIFKVIYKQIRWKFLQNP